MISGHLLARSRESPRLKWKEEGPFPGGEEISGQRSSPVQGSSKGGWEEGESGRAQMRNCCVWGGRHLLILLQPPSQHTPPASSRLEGAGEAHGHHLCEARA